MKRIFLLSILLLSVSISSFAKKDINAWKNEKNLEQQYAVFKKNLNFWNGNYFLNEIQLNEFYGALKDSVGIMEKEAAEKTNRIKALQDEVNSTNQQLKDINAELDASLQNQNAIEVFGLQMEKTVYTLIMSLIILGLAAILAVVYLLFKRSSKITNRAKKDYEELKEEFEVHKKKALERYTQMNMELQHTRLELNRK